MIFHTVVLQNLCNSRDDITGQEADIELTREKPIPSTECTSVEKSDLSRHGTRAENPSGSLSCPLPEDSSSEHESSDNTDVSKFLKALQRLRRDVTKQIHTVRNDVLVKIHQIRDDIVRDLGQKVQEFETNTTASLAEINMNLGANNVNVGLLVEAATRSSVAVGGRFDHKFMAGGTWSSIQDLCSAALNASQIFGSEKQQNAMELGRLEDLVLKKVESNEIPFLEALCVKCNITISSNALNMQHHEHRDNMVKSLGEYHKAQLRSSQTRLEALQLVHDFYGQNRNSQDSFNQKMKQSNSLAFMIYIWSLDKSFKTELEIDCVGCSTLMDDSVEVHLGEITTCQSALAHGSTRLKIRLLALHAVMLLYERRKIVLTGHIFCAKRMAQKLWQNMNILAETVGSNAPVKIEVHDAILSSRLS
jgi:hypothetical protein